MKNYPSNTPICIKTRSVKSMLIQRVHRIFEGLETPAEFIALCIDKSNLIRKIFGHKNLRKKLHATRMLKKFRSMGFIKNDHYDFKGIKIPFVSIEILGEFLNQSFDDDYYFYLFKNDEYNENEIDKYYYLMLEGPYFLKNDLVNVTINPGDVVIDVGSWIGDFAAYCAVKNAVTYAFEPSSELFKILEQTAELNNNKIIPVKKALGNITNPKAKITGVFHTSKNENEFQITTLDEFVKENNIKRVDFIKADIEGQERNLLNGARETLKNFAPKLAICTYHLPDDPKILPEIIKTANPNYKIVQKRMKLYASV